MKLLGFQVPFTQKALNAFPISGTRGGGGWMRILESYPGAWQQNVEIDREAVLTYSAVFACSTLIASDISKLRIKVVEQATFDAVWKEIENPAYSPVLRKPNKYQNRIQFIENWVLSKLSSGNTYILKGRDNRGVVNALYILDWRRVTPLVTDSGDVYYQLDSDKLAGLNQDQIIVPAMEIIHDRYNCIYHPLVGISPIIAAGLTATQGMNIQQSSTQFFGNRAMPGGILVAPGEISDQAAAELKAYWNTNFTGVNAGKIAVLGDNMRFEKLSTDANAAQLIEQLKWSAEIVCSVFHVPPYKIGVGTMPTYNNIQSLNVEYYSQALQSLIEQMELCLDEGLEFKKGMGTELDVENLLRMDSITQMEVLEKASGVLTIDEKRRKLELDKVTGGGSVYLQQQNYSLDALAKRDAKDDPFAKEPATPPANNDNADGDTEAAAAQQRRFRRRMESWGRKAARKYKGIG